MCIVTLHTQDHPQYKLIVAANRDEFYERPTAQAAFWKDAPSILGGRDLQQMGTWLGITTSGRIALLTNYRNPDMEQNDKKSRGSIVHDFLKNEENATTYLEHLRTHKEEYNGFNLIVGNVDELYHYGNHGPNITQLERGTYSVSNGGLEANWPKTKKAKAALQRYVKQEKNLDIDTLFSQLNDRELAKDEELPNTGVPFELEQKLSSIFIKMPQYGTRSSTVILVTHDNNVTFVERTFQQGQFVDERRFDFNV